jgi:hypothetical protein
MAGAAMSAKFTIMDAIDDEIAEAIAVSRRKKRKGIAPHGDS